MVVPRCCLEASFASDANTTALAEILLSDPSSREKSGAVSGSRMRITTKNKKTGSCSSLPRLVQSLHVFRDDRVIGMVIGSDYREGSEKMAEAEASILTI